MHTVQTVLLTPTFERQAVRAGLDEEEVQEIVSVLAANPSAGDLMRGTGGLRKLRFARRGEGKSGGYRTIHYFGGEDIPVLLMALIDKRDTANLSQAQRNDLAKIVQLIVASFRKGSR